LTKGLGPWLVPQAELKRNIPKIKVSLTIICSLLIGCKRDKYQQINAIMT
jgi:hypothetical protein